MAYREVTMVEVKEVLRQWLAGGPASTSPCGSGSIRRPSPRPAHGRTPRARADGNATGQPRSSDSTALCGIAIACGPACARARGEAYASPVLQHTAEREARLPQAVRVGLAPDRRTPLSMKEGPAARRGIGLVVGRVLGSRDGCERSSSLYRLLVGGPGRMGGLLRRCISERAVTRPEVS
jgi:hypothetical protein